MTGLSILLLTRTREVTDNLEEVEATYLSVRMSGVEVAQVGMSDLMRQNSLVPLRIAMNDGAIGVTYDGVPLISALLVDGLHPTADWALSLSATTGPTRATCTRSTTCDSPSSPAAAPPSPSRPPVTCRTTRRTLWSTATTCRRRPPPSRRRRGRCSAARASSSPARAPRRPRRALHVWGSPWCRAASTTRRAPRVRRAAAARRRRRRRQRDARQRDGRGGGAAHLAQRPGLFRPDRLLCVRPARPLVAYGGVRPRRRRHGRHRPRRRAGCADGPQVPLRRRRAHGGGHRRRRRRRQLHDRGRARAHVAAAVPAAGRALRGEPQQPGLHGVQPHLFHLPAADGRPPHARSRRGRRRDLGVAQRLGPRRRRRRPLPVPIRRRGGGGDDGRAAHDACVAPSAAAAGAETMLQFDFDPEHDDAHPPAGPAARHE